MNTMKKLLNTALLLFAVLMTSCTAPNAWELVSKDSNVRFALENKQENGSTMLSYSVFYKDGVAMEKSLLGRLWIIVSMEKTHNLFPLLL
jgi:hypothetical protein